MKKKFLFLASFLGVTTGFAYDWNDFDPASWPTDGDVRIPAGTTVTVDDDHVEAFAGWKNIYFENTTSKIVFANVSKTAYFNASIAYGNGTISATDCPGLVITGDNSKLGASGTWTFKNSSVVVSNEFGLGSASSGATTMKFTAAGTLGSLQFGLPNGQAFTNHTQIVYDGENGCTTMSIGSASPDEKFVQDGNFFVNPNAMNRKLYFKNNYEQISGYFGYRVAVSGSLYTYGTTGCKVTIGGSTKVIVGTNDPTVTPSNWFLMNGGEYHFANAEGGFHLNQMSWHIGCDVHFDVNNVFKSFYTDSGKATGLIVYAPFATLQTNATDWNRFNLHGHDLSFNHFSAGTVSPTSGRYYYFENDGGAATVTLVGDSSGSTYFETWGAPVEFRGKTSFTVDNKAHNKISERVSTTEGTLTVKDGSTLEYISNGGWSGAETVVESNATLIANSAKAFVNETGSLIVEDGGCLVIKTGSSVRFGSVRLGQTVLRAGTHTVAALKANPATAEYVDGDDAASVYIPIPEWTGWPDEEGAIVYLPADRDITVGDTDLPKVAKVSEIVMNGKRLLFSRNANPVAVNADISGIGVIKYYMVKDAITLRGDSRGFAGEYEFDRCHTIAVSNEYALSSVPGKSAKITFGGDTRLLFGQEGRTSFTNHANIVITPYSGITSLIFGSESADTYFVQDGDLLFNGPNPNSYVYFRNNYEQVSGTFGCGTFNGDLYLSAEGANVRFVGTTRIRNCEETGEMGTRDIQIRDGGTYTFGGTGGARFNGLMVHTGTSVYFEADDVFHDYLETGAGYGLNAFSPFTMQFPSYWNLFDLKGHDIAFHRFADETGSAGSNVKYYYLTSDDPATVTLSGDAQGADYSNQRPSVELRGAISLTVDNNATNCFAKRFSTATGTLNVKTGALVFLDDGGWSGTNVVIGANGTLGVGAGVASKLFGIVGKRSSAVLAIDAGGRLDLADGERLSVDRLVVDGELLDRGIYGGPAARAAGLVDAAHTLDCIVGRGLVRAQRHDSGMSITIR